VCVRMQGALAETVRVNVVELGRSFLELSVGIESQSFVKLTDREFEVGAMKRHVYARLEPPPEHLVHGRNTQPGVVHQSAVPIPNDVS